MRSGTAANRDVLNVLAEVRRRVGDKALRHRIEHVQCIHDDDSPRLAQLDVIASVQPIHATSDMIIVDRHWGAQRAQGAYAFRRLLDSGAHLVFGSDGPIEPHDPLIGIHARRHPPPRRWNPRTGWLAAAGAHHRRRSDRRLHLLAGLCGGRGRLSGEHHCGGRWQTWSSFPTISSRSIRCGSSNARVDMTVLSGKIVWRG